MQAWKKLGVIMCLAFAALAASGGETTASDWMFRRSYYSHTPARGQIDAGPGQEEAAPGSRSIRREPWVGAHPRFAIRGAWRVNTFSIQNGMGSSDRTYFRESYFDANY